MGKILEKKFVWTGKNNRVVRNRELPLKLKDYMPRRRKPLDLPRYAGFYSRKERITSPAGILGQK